MTNPNAQMQQPNDPNDNVSTDADAQKPKPRPMPPPPEDAVGDADRIAGAERRWEECPLNDCKRNADLLYGDFYLRGVRSDRLLCSACAVQTEVGYMAREVVRKQEDRFFAGTPQDYLVVFGVITGMSAVVNAIVLAIGFWLIAFFIGGAVGAFIGTTARRLTGGRVGRQSPQVAVAAVITGALLAPILFGIFNFGFEYVAIVLSNPSFYLRTLINFPVIICSAIMGTTIYGIFLRRI